MQTRCIVCRFGSCRCRYVSEVAGEDADGREIEFKSGRMITKCANPACSTVFRYLRGGKLFLFEVPQRQRRCRPLQKSEFRSGEYFWLCEECAKSMTITSRENGHALVTARSKGT